MQLIWLVDAIEIMIIRRFFHAIFSSILAFLVISVILIFWIFLIVFRLIICVYNSELVIAYLVVIIKTIKIIDDLIELKFEKNVVDLNVSWFDDFIWNDLNELNVCDFLRFCAAFFILNLVTNLNSFLIVIFNLVCIANNSIFVSIFTIFVFSSRSWLIWLMINNIWEFSITTYAFNITVLVFWSLVLIFCLFRLNVNNKISFILFDLRLLIEFCLMEFFDVYVKFADVISINWLTDWLNVWLTNCLTDWFFDWLIDWLIDWLNSAVLVMIDVIKIFDFNFIIISSEDSCSSDSFFFFYWFRFIVRMQPILVMTDLLSKYNFSEFL